MAKINRNNTSINKQYKVILFNYCVCLFSNLDKHIIFIIYFPKYGILFKMSTVYCKEIMCYILRIHLHIFVNVPFN